MLFMQRCSGSHAATAAGASENLTRDIQLLQIFIVHKASEQQTSDSNKSLTSHLTWSEIPDYSEYSDYPDYSAVTGTLKPASF